MDYVMVPVPEDQVVDVAILVARLVGKASVEPWNDSAVADCFDELDDLARSVLSVVARATSNVDVNDEDAAKSLGLSVKKIRAIIREINEFSTRSKREPMLGLREATVELPDGGSASRRVFVMTDAVASAIRAHEQAPGETPAVPSDSEE